MAEQVSMVIAFTPLWLPAEIFNRIIVILAAVGLVFIAMVYIRIYLAVRRHNRQIHTLQVQHGTQTGEKVHFAILLSVHFMYTFCFLFVIYLT